MSINQIQETENWADYISEYATYKTMSYSDAYCVFVPYSIIVNQTPNTLSYREKMNINSECLNMSIHRLLAYFYFASKQNSKNSIEKATNIINFFNYIPDRHKNGINNSVINDIIVLQELGYIKIENDITEIKGATKLSISITEKFKKVLEEKKLAAIYTDEIRKIINFKKEYPTTEISYIMLVLAYIRMMIFNRPVCVEYIAGISMEKRKKESPEVFASHYKYIAQDLGINETTVSKAVSILEKLEIIHHQVLPRNIDNNGMWRCEKIIFTNYAKREGNREYAKGKQYYMKEIENYIVKKNIPCVIYSEEFKASLSERNNRVYQQR